MGNIKTLHVVGYKNSGKTTLVSNWVRLAKSFKLKVAVIKHHGHGTKLAMPDEKKDSMQYLTAGADASLVAGGGFTQHMMQNELTYEQLLALAELENPDIILVEGYKKEAGEKAILVKEQEDWETLQQLDDIQLVIGLEDEQLPYEQIDQRDNQIALDQWFTAWLKDDS